MFFFHDLHKRGHTITLIRLLHASITFKYTP